MTYLVKDTCKFFKVRDYEQSVMKSDRLFQARGPATANALSPMHCGTWCTSRADEDDDRSRRREVTSATR